MREFGQYLVAPSAYLDCLSLWGIVGVGVMAVVLGSIRSRVLRVLAPRFTTWAVVASLAVGGLASVASTLVLTSSALLYTHLMVQSASATGATSANHTNRDFSSSGSVPTNTATIRNAPSPTPQAKGFVPRVPVRVPFNPTQDAAGIPRVLVNDDTRGTTKGIPWQLAHSREPTSSAGSPSPPPGSARASEVAQKDADSVNRPSQNIRQIRPPVIGGKNAGVVMLLLLVIGFGYAYLDSSVGLLQTMGCASAGIGLPEELAKAYVGLLLVSWMGVKTVTHLPQFRREVLAAFGLAGLGFGALEAFKYFGEYAAAAVPPYVYLVRAAWCVPLHGAWSILVGVALLRLVAQEKLKAGGENIVTPVVIACIPLAITHGVYDAFCTHDSSLLWAVGCVSFAAAAGFLCYECRVVRDDTCAQLANEPH